MYPLAPVVPLSRELARTGLPVATLLLLATVLVVAGLLLVRASVQGRAAAGVEVP